MEDNFWLILDWLKSKTSFGVDHVVLNGRCYYLDTESDRRDLYNMFLMDITK